MNCASEMTDVALAKRELRKEIRRLKQQQLQAADSRDVAECLLQDGHDVAERLLQDGRINGAGTILLYHALSDEVPTQELMDILVARGKTVVLPCVTGPTDMLLRRYNGPQDLVKGAFGIWEPMALPPFTDYDAIEVALIPGMSFDRHGHRLGRGKGYYDRFLPRIPRATKIGVCYAFQLVGQVPTDANDIPMDDIIIL